MTILSGLASAPLFSALAEATSPALRELGYGANRKLLNLIPSPVSVIDAWMRGYDYPHTSNDSVQSFGVDLSLSGAPFDLDEWLTGTIRPAKPATTHPNRWTVIADAAKYTPSVPSVIQAFRRGVISPSDVWTYLRRAGIHTQSQQLLALVLYTQVPSVQQLVNYDTINAWGSNPAGPPDMLKEISDPYERFCNAAGEGVIDIRDPINPGVLATLDTGHAAWAAHWRWPSFATVIAWQRRFIPAAAPGSAWLNPDGATVPAWLKDLSRKHQGIHPDMVDLETSATRPLPPLRLLRGLIATGDMDEGSLMSYFMAQGYDLKSAEKMATSLQTQVQRQTLSQALGAAHGLYEQAWDLGFLDDQAYVTSLQELGLTDQQVALAFTVSQLRQDITAANEMVAATKRRFMKGELSRAQSTGLLTKYGVSAVRAGELIDRWTDEHTAADKSATAAQWQRLAAQGLVTVDAMATALFNLDYGSDYIALAVAETSYLVQLALSKALSQQVANNQKRRKAAAAAVKQAQQLLRSAQSQLTRHGSVPQLVTWWKDGLIPTDELVGRLQFLGWPAVDIDRLLQASVITSKGTPVPYAGPQESPGPVQPPAPGFEPKPYPPTDTTTVGPSGQ